MLPLAPLHAAPLTSCATPNAFTLPASYLKSLATLTPGRPFTKPYGPWSLTWMLRNNMVQLTALSGPAFSLTNITSAYMPWQLLGFMPGIKVAFNAPNTPRPLSPTPFELLPETTFTIFNQRVIKKVLQDTLLLNTTTSAPPALAYSTLYAAFARPPLLILPALNTDLAKLLQSLEQEIRELTTQTPSNETKFTLGWKIILRNALQGLSTKFCTYSALNACKDVNTLIGSQLRPHLEEAKAQLEDGILKKVKLDYLNAFLANLRDFEECKIPFWAIFVENARTRIDKIYASYQGYREYRDKEIKKLQTSVPQQVHTTFTQSTGYELDDIDALLELVKRVFFTIGALHAKAQETKNASSELNIPLPSLDTLRSFAKSAVAFYRSEEPASRVCSSFFLVVRDFVLQRLQQELQTTEHAVDAKGKPWSKEKKVITKLVIGSFARQLAGYSESTLRDQHSVNPSTICTLPALAELFQNARQQIANELRSGQHGSFSTTMFEGIVFKSNWAEDVASTHQALNNAAFTLQKIDTLLTNLQAQLTTAQEHHDTMINIIPNLGNELLDLLEHYAQQK